MHAEKRAATCAFDPPLEELLLWEDWFVVVPTRATPGVAGPPPQPAATNPRLATAELRNTSVACLGWFGLAIVAQE
jgi:hypothetical protein